MGVTSLFGVLSVIVEVSAHLYYLKRISSNQTKPHCFSWFIWCFVAGLVAIAQTSEQAGPGAWLSYSVALFCLLIGLFSLWRQGMGYVTRGDWVIAGLALLAIPLWLITETPLWSAVLVTTMDVIGYIPTIRKAVASPDDEAPLAWLLWTVSHAFSLLAMEAFNVTTLVYPAAMILANLVLLVALAYSRASRKGAL